MDAYSEGLEIGCFPDCVYAQKGLHASRDGVGRSTVLDICGERESGLFFDGLAVCDAFGVNKLREGL